MNVNKGKAQIDIHDLHIMSWYFITNIKTERFIVFLTVVNSVLHSHLEDEKKKLAFTSFDCTVSVMLQNIDAVHRAH